MSLQLISRLLVLSGLIMATLYLSKPASAFAQATCGPTCVCVKLCDIQRAQCVAQHGKDCTSQYDQCIQNCNQ